MKNFISTFLFTSLILFGCNNSKNKVKIDEKDTVSIENVSIIPDSIIPDSIITIDTIAKIDIIEDALLFPSSYRMVEHTELKTIVTSKSWKEISLNNRNYQINKADFILSEIGKDECSGMMTQGIKSANNAILFFSIPQITDGKLDTVALSINSITPDKPFEFEFNDKKFKLKASGIDFNNDSGVLNAKNEYILKLYSEHYPKGFTLIHQNEYNDTSTKLVMITDLDKDGYPDFIFSSPRHYEEERYLIILSSNKTTYEGIRVFDC
ncbi:hypothetical protein [Sphingobacterium bovistauri]|uniref:Repeat domain-containing protein n=1 Tax=Sphingobacterium bovistauri TaxID=2781959 RepID=A0ABS7Z7L0_9SPHI|nr:hypothetical protein [Sphingobacterium bovistauri]MCA5004929.1 hypothetical protein [Sphingobacterium bovistauri]